MHLRTTIRRFAAMCLASGLAATATATPTDGIGDMYWIGDVDASYTNPANWRFGSATGATMQVAPKDNDYHANINLTEAASKDHRTITGANAANSILVTAGEWKYGFSGTKVVKNLTVKGGATLTVNAGTPKNMAISVEAGALVTLPGLYWDSSSVIKGAGTVILASGINGFADSRMVTIGSGLVRINATTLFSGKTGNSFIMNNKAGRVQYKGTLAAAQKLIGVSGNGKGGVVAGSSIPEGYELAVRELDDPAGYVEFYFRQTAQPILASASVARTVEGAFRVTAQLSQGAEGTSVKAIAVDGSGNMVETVYDGTVTAEEDFSFDLENLVDGSTYTVKVVAANDSGSDEKSVPTAFYNGALGLALTTDAQERDTVPGIVTVSRAQAGAALTVNYAFAGVTAVEGTDYAAPTGTVTIPEGAISAEILVQPIMNAARQEDTTLDVSLESGLYAASAAPVRVTIHDFTIPSDACVWMGGVDNKASTAANWYQEKLPTRNDKILLAAFSPANLVWDAGVNDLPDTVAAWEQTVDYMGTVTFATTYPEQGAFTVFTVTGDCAVNGGKWTHLANEAQPSNRLCVAVGGSFTLGESASIDVSAKGYGPGQCAPGGDQGVHGGSRGDPAKLRGSWLAPTELGAGGASNRRGGGALWLEVARAAVIDGAIHADSSSVTAQSTAAAGGSVYLQAASVTGAGSISADALPRRYDLYGNPGGSGGRIAIVVTEAEVCGLSDAKLTAYGMWGGPSAGAGTIRIKTASHTHDGKLLVASNGGVQSYGTRRPRKTETTVVPPGETWTLDELKFREEGVLGVPTGARLVLPNGAVSVSAVSERTAGLVALGGEIDFGAGDQTFQKNWIFQADTPYIFDCNVIVTDGAVIGCLPFAGGVATGLASEYAVCDVTVTKNLTVTPTGFLSANNGGPNYPYNHEYQSSHGGQSREYTMNLAYDSVFNPTRPGKGNTGGDQGRSFAGGGALLVTVGETLTLDGVASANSTDSKEGRAASGGTLNIRAKRLAGTGRGSASASFGTWTASSGFGGGGGRIAVRVTETPLEGATVWRNFKATGAALNGTAFASAGTVYLETGAQGENGGTIYVHNGGPCAAWTALPSRNAGGEEDVYTKANLEISANGAVKLFESLKLSSLTMTAPAKLDLNGRTLTVTKAKLGDLKLKPSTYKASDAALEGFVTDSSEAETGTLVVTGGGIVIFVK